MDILWSTVLEGIKERDNMMSTGMGRICIHNGAEKFNLVTGSFSIPTSRFNYFEGRMAFFTERKDRLVSDCLVRISRKRLRISIPMNGGVSTSTPHATSYKQVEAGRTGWDHAVNQPPSILNRGDQLAGESPPPPRSGRVW